MIVEWVVVTNGVSLSFLPRSVITDSGLHERRDMAGRQAQGKGGRDRDDEHTQACRSSMSETMLDVSQRVTTLATLVSHSLSASIPASHGP